MAQSLPSFAQAFNTPSLNSISSTSNALPPIHFRSPSLDHSRPVVPPTQSHPPRANSASLDPNGQNNNHRKRSRPSNNISLPVRDDDLPDTDRLSPRLIQIKEEHDFPMADPPNNSNSMVVDPNESPHSLPPSALLPTPSKKRRVTISGTPHPLNTDIHLPATDQTNSTPISPVVIGLSIQRDDPAALEQVRSMLSVKQKQKALIEQRRGSVAGILSTGPGTGTSAAAQPAQDSISDDRHPMVKAPTLATRPHRRSPNPSTATSSRRPQQQPILLPQLPSTTGNPPSPSPMIVPSQQPVPIIPAGPPKGNPLPPPISFARRRAGQFGAGKKKPADIVIRPRESHSHDQLQPAIQSAPPVLHAGQEGQQQQLQQLQFLSRFPMAIPRLPSIGMGAEGHNNHGTRRPIAGQVPPTPSRFSLQRNNNNSSNHPPTSNLASQHPTGPPNQFGARSPPASVAIATSLVPPTPTALQHPGYSGDKSAFLAPFSVFYDALNDSKQLKNWLGEQMHKSNTLLERLTAQQEKMDELVESLVEKKTAGMRQEVAVLHRRVEELEDALRVARSEMITRRQSMDVVPMGPVPATTGRASGKQPVRNGIGTTSLAATATATDSYTFPPVQPMRKSPPPPLAAVAAGWRSERERDNQGSLPGSENGSPAPYSARRLSISAMRLDPPRMQQQQQQLIGEPSSSSSTSSQSQSQASFGLHSPPPALSQLSLSQQQQQAFRDGPTRHGLGHSHGPLASPRGKSGTLSTSVMAYRSGGHGATTGEHRSGSPMDDD